MPNSFRFEILTPEKTFYSGEVTSIMAPGTEGYFGVLAHHAPLIAKSNGGKLKVREVSNQERFFNVGPGIVEVLPKRLQPDQTNQSDRVIFLTRQAETAS